MDSQPERRKDYGKRVEVWWEGDNVYYRGTIFEYSKNTDKHTVYYDDGEKEKVALATTPHRYEECEPWAQPETCYHARKDCLCCSQCSLHSHCKCTLQA